MPGTIRSDRGNVTPAVIGLVGVLMILIVGTTDVARFFLARTQAQTAADSAALAAAQEMIPGGRSTPEIEAERFATLNGALLRRCECREGMRIAEAYVAVPVTFGLLGRRDVRARARAEVDLFDH